MHKIQTYLLQQIPKHPTDIVKTTMQAFGVSRTTVLRHLQQLIKASLVIKTGATKQTSYALKEALTQRFSFPINKKTDEYLIYDQHLAQLIDRSCNPIAKDILEYSLTEMLNNCKDHSHGSRIDLSIEVTHATIKVCIEDNGVGVFSSLQPVVGSNDIREVLLQLSKGKLTSDTANHSGEGIFFTSRACDSFTILANGYCFCRDNRHNDWSLQKSEHKKGSTILLEVDRGSSKSLVDLFKLYQSKDDLQFSKTEVIIELAKDYGQRMISRSQAQRVTRNLESFSDVTLDFKNVTAIGQGFVDQIFRVYQNQHSDLTLRVINANDDVTFMIQRGITE